MFELIEYNGGMYASARGLHSDLGIRKDFPTWAQYNIKRAMLDKSDFITKKGESTGGRPSVDYLLTKESAIAFIMFSGGEKAKDVRAIVIRAFEEKQTGISLTLDEVKVLTDMVKAMTLVSIQKDSEKKHYEYLNKPKDWWDYRSKLLGYSTATLKDALRNVGRNYKSQKQALIHIDPAEIIRTGVIDLLIALGNERKYALNIGEWAKAIAISNGYHFQIWNDIKPNPLGINKGEINERKKLL